MIRSRTAGLALPAALLALAAALLAGCGGSNEGDSRQGPSGAVVPATAGELVQADGERADPEASPDQVESLVGSNNEFALDLFGLLRAKQENLFLSPLSISEALSMTLAGARGQTAEEMRGALKLELPDDQLHESWNALDGGLPREGEAEGSEGRFTLSIANAIWPQAGLDLEASFLETLTRQYGSGVRPLDFGRDPEGSRQRINEWVASETNDRIEELIDSGAIDALTRLVLTNAIYFKADWTERFHGGLTAAFRTADGDEVRVPYMSRRGPVRYGRGEGYETLELPYAGDAYSMVLIVPDAGRYEEIEAGLDRELVDEAVAAIEPHPDGNVTIPKLRYRSQFNLAEALRELGMASAFGGADFSGITPDADLEISEVIHEASVAVTERGTEAAAATAVTMRMSAPPVNVFVDRPFVFLIRDRESGAILFLGRVLRP